MKKTVELLTMMALGTALLMTACGKENGGGAEAFREDGSSFALFSVSSSKQVRFSQGNLQFQASSGTWRFAEHQYDCIGSANKNISPATSDWIDLFGWGTSGWESGANADQPWSTSVDAGDYYPGAADTNDLMGDYVWADWAWYNINADDDDSDTLWRTLTAEEWHYLLNFRPNASDKRGAATVGEIHGMVILPDSWTAPSELSFIPNFNGSEYDDYSKNSVYTPEEWSRMESAGAIFLPAAGLRKGKDIYFVGSIGGYWSTTCGGERSACNVGFNGNYFGSDDRNERCVGFSVRPVRDKYIPKEE